MGSNRSENPEARKKGKKLLARRSQGAGGPRGKRGTIRVGVALLLLFPFLLLLVAGGWALFAHDPVMPHGAPSAPPVLAQATVPPQPLRAASISVQGTVSPQQGSGEGVSGNPTPLFAPRAGDLPPDSFLPPTDDVIVNAPLSAARQRILTPRIALIIDDLGPDAKAARQAIALPAFVALAFLPYAEGLKPLVLKAWEAGHTVLVHMPMEPEDVRENNPGPQALTSDLPPSEIERRVQAALDAVPGAAGMNNHMGSRFTTDERGMGDVMGVLAIRRLFFIDSLTTPQSVAKSVARRKRVPFAARDVFLDNMVEPGALAHQLAELEQTARRKGSAIAIGHPHALTLDTLQRWIPEARSRGVEFVSVTSLVTSGE